MKHPALDNVRKVANWKENKTYVFSLSNVFEEDGILNLPWYMAPFMRQSVIPEGTIYHADVAALNEKAGLQSDTTL